MNPELPALDASQQRLSEITAGAGRRFPVRFGNDISRIRCAFVPVNWTPEISIPLHIGGEAARLELALTPGGRLFERHAEYRDISGLSEPFALAIRAALSRELIDSLQTAFDSGIEIPAKPSTHIPPLALALEIQNADSQREGSAVLRIGEKTLARIESICTSWESESNPSTLAARQTVAFGVAFFDLPFSKLASLLPGDCLVLGEASAWPFPGWISAGSTPMPLGFAPKAPMPLLFSLDQPTQPMSTNANTPAPLADLRLPVLVVAARKELTLQEIASLREGASLEIGTGEEIPVELQVNNQVVATGRLVRVADKICASITETRSLPSA
ncbi:MAG: FliM/FliN family flagellar motor switch protein [Spartobacteria bacterium]